VSKSIVTTRACFSRSIPRLPCQTLFSTGNRFAERRTAERPPSWNRQLCLAARIGFGGVRRCLAYWDRRVPSSRPCFGKRPRPPVAPAGYDTDPRHAGLSRECDLRVGRRDGVARIPGARVGPTRNVRHDVLDQRCHVGRLALPYDSVCELQQRNAQVVRSTWLHLDGGRLLVCLCLDALKVG